LVAEALAKVTFEASFADRLVSVWMPAFAKATAGDRSTGSKQTPNGLFIFASNSMQGKRGFTILHPALLYS
jgi:hypothetical protein